MQISKSVTEVLSNFGKLNTGIMFNPGSVLMTRHQYGQIPMAKAEFGDVEFPKKCVVHDIPKLVSVLSMFKDPVLNFNDEELVVSDRISKRTAKIKYGSPQVVVCADYSIEPKFPEVDIEFDLSDSDFSYLSKSIGTFSAPEVAIIGNKGKLFVSTYNATNPSSDQFLIEVGETSDKFTILINSTHFQFLPRSYHVRVAFKGLIEFSNTTDNNKLTYWVTRTDKSKIG